jgi:hypothetical protein
MKKCETCKSNKDGFCKKIQVKVDSVVACPHYKGGDAK